MQKLKVNDVVVVLTGKDKGKNGKIKKINFKTNRVVVEGMNLVKKTQKPTQQNQQGGIVDQEQSLHISNVNPLSTKTGKAGRVKIAKSKDGKNSRILAKCKTALK